MYITDGVFALIVIVLVIIFMLYMAREEAQMISEGSTTPFKEYDEEPNWGSSFYKQMNQQQKEKFYENYRIPTERSNTDVTAYATLNIQAEATTSEIKKAHRKLVAKWHPDKYTSNTEEKQARSKEMFTEVQEAYAQLKISREIE